MFKWAVPLAVLAAVSCSKGSNDAAPSSGPAASTTSSSPAMKPQELASLLDIPPYPNATFPDDMSKAPVKDSEGNTHAELVMTTPDPVERVIDFYSSRLKLAPAPMGAQSSIIGKTPKGNDLILMVGTEASHTVIRAKAIVYHSK